MPQPDYLDPRLTERRNPRTTGIDEASSLEIVDLLSAEDREVPAAVHAARAEIARAMDLTVAAFRGGGRLLYVGAGTSGRLGVLDAAECPPTFGTPPEMVVGIIAGGTAALTRGQEGAEDDEEGGAQAMHDHAVTAGDFVLGIAASGTTPFVSAAIRRAKALGATVGLFTCAHPPAELTTICDVVIAVPAGAEALTGSTRLKAGTATKLALNTITTGAMVQLGKAYGNLMVDLRAVSAKLHDRAERIVMEVCGVDRETAHRLMADADGSAKLAIVIGRRGVDASVAQGLLDEAGGIVRRVIGDPPQVAP